jgi:hypothetical protein
VTTGDNEAGEEISHGGHVGHGGHGVDQVLGTDEIPCLFGRFPVGVTYWMARASFWERDLADLSHGMNYVNRSHLHLRPVGWYAFMLSLLILTQAVFAEDPIVVHYSDPSLTRLETQIGVSAAQKDRFEDIVVKYRDPLSSTETNNSAQGAPRSGKHGGGRGSTQNSPDQSDALPRRGKEKVTRAELDELATILTPAQIKKFQDLNGGTIKKRHSS